MADCLSKSEKVVSAETVNPEYLERKTLAKPVG